MDTPAAPQPAVPDLPDGLSARPLSIGDARAAYELLAAEEERELGTVEIEEADVVADWQRPSWNISSRTVGAFAEGADGPRLVGYAEVTHDQLGCAAVHPDHWGRGIGTALARWMQAAARSQGMSRIGMSVPAGSAADRLLEGLGYENRWQSWLLELPGTGTVPERPLPEGYAVRAAADDELEAAWQVNEDAFLEWSERERRPFADWRAGVVERPGFEPWHLRVCLDARGDVAGMLLLQVPAGGGDPGAHVDRLAVRADQRRRGLAQALLADAYAEAASRGARRCTLATDSRTDARSLYEGLGMRVVSTWHHRSIAL